MIIIEGSDSTGKTTLAHELSEKVGKPYRHQGRPPEGYNYLGDGRHELAEVVQDRFHLGELVYGAILGDTKGRHSSFQDVWELDRIILAQRIPVVILYWGDTIAYTAHLDGMDWSEQMYSKQSVIAANLVYHALTKQHEHYIRWDVSKNGWPSRSLLLAMIGRWRATH
jgi:hypothetical protein